MSEATEKRLLHDIVEVVEKLRDDQIPELIDLLRAKFCLDCGKRYAEDAVRRSCSCERDE